MRPAALVVLLTSFPAFACAVCGAGDDPSKGSYIAMSVIISLLPLLMIGGIIGYVVVKTRGAAREAQAAPAEPVKS